MKFLVDCMLGKLAKKLRILGYDTVYYRGKEAHQLIQMARQERRVILTRNTKLKPKREEDLIIRVIEDNPLLQLKELVNKGYVAKDDENLFSRCILCNTILEEISRAEAAGKVPDFVFHQYNEFFQCPQCQRIYWPGSHLENMQKRLEEIRINTKSQALNHN